MAIDYKDRSFFNTLVTRIKGVFSKTGASPWFEPAIYYKTSPLSAEEVHDNFQILTAGELNLNERTSDIEDSIVPSSYNIKGALAYNGHQEGEGYLYGGAPYNLLSPTDIVANLGSDTINLQNPSNALFHVAEGDGIKYFSSNGLLDNENTVWYSITADYGGLAPGLITYLNGRLRNNGAAFSFIGSDLTSNVTTVCNWGVNPTSFNISFNDEDFKTVSLSVSYGTVATAATYIAAKITEAFPSYASAFTVTASGNRLVLTGISNIANQRLTRIRIQNAPGQVSLNTDWIGWLTAGDRIFDFSNALEFYLSGSKVGLRGKNAYFRMIAKDDATKPLFPTLKLQGTITSVYPYYTFTHTSYPTSDMAVEANFGGHLHVSKLTSVGDIVGPINSSAATIGTLNVTTLNASGVNIPNADITLQDLTASTVTTPSLSVSTLATIASENVTNSNITTLAATNAALESATIPTLLATNATITNLTVSSGNLNTNSLQATSVTCSIGTINQANISDLIITRTAKTAGRLYTTATGSAYTVDPPTSTSSQAPWLSYDGHFRATAMYVGTTVVTSLRSLKKDITPFERSALDIINDTLVVNYKLKSDPEEIPHVGFIADDTDSALSGPNKDQMDVGSNIGVLLKAVQELTQICRGQAQEILDLRKDLEELRSSTN